MSGSNILMYIWTENENRNILIDGSYQEVPCTILKYKLDDNFININGSKKGITCIILKYSLINNSQHPEWDTNYQQKNILGAISSGFNNDGEIFINDWNTTIITETNKFVFAGNVNQGCYDDNGCLANFANTTFEINSSNDALINSSIIDDGSDNNGIPQSIPLSRIVFENPDTYDPLPEPEPAPEPELSLIHISEPTRPY